MECQHFLDCIKHGIDPADQRPARPGTGADPGSLLASLKLGGGPVELASRIATFVKVAFNRCRAEMATASKNGNGNGNGKSAAAKKSAARHRAEAARQAR